MRTQHWLVKKPSGEEWGFIKRLVIHPTMKCITYADVIVTDTGRLVRLPWVNFKIGSHGIVLSMPERQMKARVMRASGTGLPKAVTLDVCAVKTTA